MTTVKAPRARRGKAVAEEAAAAPEADTPATPAPAGLACVSCPAPAVWQSDGITANEVAYCAEHLPGNVSQDMVDGWRAPR